MFIGAVCWLIRDTTDVVSRKAIVVAGIINAVVGFVTSLYFTLSGGLTTFGWSAVLIYLVFGIGWIMSLNSTKNSAA